jgi:exopolysaccharide production protein ExoQ
VTLPPGVSGLRHDSVLSRWLAANEPGRREELDSLRAAVEWIFVAGLLFFLSEGVRYVVLNPGGQGSRVLQDDPTRAYAQLAIYIITIVVCATHTHAIIGAARNAWLFWALVALVVMSAVWSVDRDLTLRNAVWLGTTSLLGVAFELRYSLRQQLNLLAVTLGLVIALSFAFVAFVPALGMEPSIHSGAWRGVFIHRNSLGRAMVLAALVFALLLPGARRSFVYLAIGLAGAVALALLSRSATPPILFAALILLVPISGIIRWRAFPLPLALGVSTVLVLLATWFSVENFEQIVKLLGRDSTLSGRPLLWASLLSNVVLRPWLGYGALAFWKGGTAEAASVEKIVGWNPGQAHNGLIDVVLDVGLVGGAVFMLGFAAALRRAVMGVRDSRSPLESMWPLSFLTFFFLSNMTETSILRPNTIFWFLYAATVTHLMRPSADRLQADGTDRQL